MSICIWSAQHLLHCCRMHKIFSGLRHASTDEEKKPLWRNFFREISLLNRTYDY